MEEFSYGDDYFTDDGSSFRTSLTHYSIDPSMTTQTEMNKQHHGLCFSRLEHACRTSCDALWWFLTESSSPAEQQRQASNALPKRSHRLRIIDSDVDGPTSSYSADPSSRQHEVPPIKWKNKGNPAKVSLQSSSSSGLSSSESSSVGATRGGGNGVVDRDIASNIRDDKQTVDKHDYAHQKKIVAFKPDGQNSTSTSKSENIRELQTVDSKVLHRRRQQKKIKDVIRFKNWNDPEVISANLPTTAEPATGGHQRTKRLSGIPPRSPRKDGRTKNSGNMQQRRGGILRKSEEHSTDVHSDAVASSSSYPNHCDHIQESNDLGAVRDASFQAEAVPARTLDEMDVAKLQGISGQHPNELDNAISLADLNHYIENDGFAESRCFFPTNSARDDTNTIRDQDDDISRISIPNVEQAWSKDKFAVYPTSQESISIAPTDASIRYHRKATSCHQATKSSNTKASSSLSVSSLNSARYAKEKFLRSRLSFDYKEKVVLSQEIAVRTETNKPREKPQQRCSKQNAASVASMDRYIRRGHIRVRAEDETMSAY
ncbi:hypothetical protein IV203_035923 [Nitzschia inconspicua]|uniref:Uncharacterized protein n=1 Tax=Nitzschia inconspicua TaxID=303405 RepID=A0A9K3PXK9_9STRA|nr:hypothetical protein IV203_035923 [Nitzschia inconspicua]